MPGFDPYHYEQRQNAGPQRGEQIRLVPPRGPSSPWSPQQRLSPDQFAPQTQAPVTEPPMKPKWHEVGGKVDRATGAMQRNRAFRTGGLGMALRYTAGLSP